MANLLDAPTTEAGRQDGDEARGYYSVSEAAALLGVSRVTVWRWIRDGRIPAARLGQRLARIRREDLEQAMEQIGALGSRSWVVRRAHDPAVAQTAFPPPDAPSLAVQPPQAAEHYVQFYDADDFMLDGVARYISAALRAGAAALVVATAEHRAGIDRRLETDGFDPERECARGRYLSLDAAETLETFMCSDLPNPERFVQVIGGAIDRLRRGGRHVSIFGEMVAMLVTEGRPRAAVRLEELWNGLQTSHTFSLLCAYPMDRLCGEADTNLLNDVCAEHSRVIPAESYSALPDSDGRLRAITLLQQKARRLEAEIAQRRHAEERLREALAAEQQARAATEVALRQRDEFLSIASHELRTPLTSLSGYAQVMLRRLKREGHVEQEIALGALKAINGQADKLARLIAQLLDISRLEADKLTLEYQTVDVAALVAQVVSNMRFKSDRHTLSLQAPDCLMARIDPLRCEQVLTNLLDNSIKYSPDGGPIEVALDQPSGDMLELTVRDHGLGIAAERRGQIFERFYQAHATSHRSGLGLGLYISRQIVDMHGGEINADFPADGGSRFLVRLPLAPPATSD